MPAVWSLAGGRPCFGQAGGKSIFDDDWVPPKDPPAVVKPPPPPVALPPAEVAPQPARLPVPPPLPAPPPVPTPPEPVPSPVPSPTPRPTVPRPAVPALPAARRQPAPNAAALAAADKLVKDVFKNEYARQTPADRAVLARLLWNEVDNARANPPERFLLLRETRDLATAAGEVELAVDAARALRSEFVIPDEAGTVLATLSAAVKNLLAVPPTAATPAACHRAAEVAIAAAEHELDAGDYPAAAQAAASAVAAATRAAAPDFLFGVKARSAEIQAVATEYATVKPQFDRLKLAPTDQAANLAAGRFLAFTANQPARGMPLLAKGSDPLLKATAAKDLEVPDPVAEQVALGDAWAEVTKAEYAKPQPPGPTSAKEAAFRRAEFWYGRALAQSEGLGRAALLKKVNEFRLPRLQRGLAGDYFHGRDFQRRAFTKVDANLDWNWKGGKPDDTLPGDVFSVRWTGWIKSPSAGRYTLIAAHDDGMRVWVDGQLVIDDWGKAGKAKADVDLTGSLQELKVEYNQTGGGSYAGLGWLAPNAKRARRSRRRRCCTSRCRPGRACPTTPPPTARATSPSPPSTRTCTGRRSASTTRRAATAGSSTGAVPPTG